MTLTELKAKWNDVLDLLEGRDRIAWISFFDARLASLKDGVLTLQFVDAEKLSGAHDYKATRNDRIKAALVEAIKEVTGLSLEIVEI